MEESRNLVGATKSGDIERVQILLDAGRRWTPGRGTENATNVGGSRW